MEKMTESQVTSAMEGVPNWAETGEAIQRTVTLKNFVESMTLVNRIAAEAERVNHHPDILIRYNKVTLTLSTHDAGGLTSKDFDLARTIDALVASRAATR